MDADGLKVRLANARLRAGRSPECLWRWLSRRQKQLTLDASARGSRRSPDPDRRLADLGLQMEARVKLVAGKEFAPSQYPNITEGARTAGDEGWIAWYILPDLLAVASFAEEIDSSAHEDVRRAVGRAKTLANGWILEKTDQASYLGFDDKIRLRRLVDDVLDGRGTGDTAMGLDASFPERERVNEMLSLPSPWVIPPRPPTPGEQIVSQLRKRGWSKYAIERELRRVELHDEEVTAMLEQLLDNDADRKHPVEGLADTLSEAWRGCCLLTAAESRLKAHTHAGFPGEDHREERRAEAIISLEAALTAIEGVDPSLRPVKGARPIEIAAELKPTLTELWSLVSSLHPPDDRYLELVQTLANAQSTLRSLLFVPAVPGDDAERAPVQPTAPRSAAPSPMNDLTEIAKTLRAMVKVPMIPNVIETAGSLLISAMKRGALDAFPEAASQVRVHAARVGGPFFLAAWCDGFAVLRERHGLPRRLYTESFDEDIELAAAIIDESIIPTAVTLPASTTADAGITSSPGGPATRLRDKFLNLEERFCRAAESVDVSEILSACYSLLREAGSYLREAFVDGMLADPDDLLQMTQSAIDADRQLAAVPSHKRAHRGVSESLFLDPYCRLFNLYADRHLADRVHLPAGGLSASDTRALSESQHRVVLVTRVHTFARCCAELAGRVECRRRSRSFVPLAVPPISESTTASSTTRSKSEKTNAPRSGWTKSELLNMHKPALAGRTFDRLRTAAEVKSKQRGSKLHRYSPDEVQRMLDAAPTAIPQSVQLFSAAWEPLLK